MKNNVCVYPFIHYPMCSIKISCNLLNFPLLRTNHNEHKPSESPFRFSICSVGFFLSISCSDLIICDYTKTIHKYTYTKVQKVDALHPYFARFLTRPTFFLCCKCVYYSILYIFISIHFCAILTQYLSNYSGARTCAWLLLLHFFLPPFHCDSSKVEAKCSVNLELFSLCVILVKPQH